MEYRLNKIDPEVREKVKEITRSGKVHAKTGAEINTYTKKNKEDREGDFEEELKKQKKKEKKKIFVEAIKVEELEIPAYKEADSSSEDENRGCFIDVRK